MKALTVVVNVYGDTTEQKQVSFLWFRESKTLFEFYAGQRSLRQCHTGIAWFPTELHRDQMFAFFERLPSSLLWHYISAPEHIVSFNFQTHGGAKWTYLDRFARDTATRLRLAGSILHTSQQAALRIQSAWNAAK